MRISYLRWIDRYLGTGICALLSILKRLSFTKRELNINKPQKIIFIKFWGMGSIILTARSLKLVRESYPASRICVLTLEQNRSVFEILDVVDEIWDVKNDSLCKFFFNIIRIIFFLRRENFDAAFDFEFTSRFSAIIAYLIGARKTAGFIYKGIWRGNFFTDKLRFREDIKLEKSFLDLARKTFSIDKANCESPLNIVINDENVGFVENLLEKQGLSNENILIGINVNASDICLLRRWPKDYFIDLSNRLIEKYSARIIFIGSNKEYQYVQGVVDRITDRNCVYNFAGKVNFYQLVCLLRKFRIVVTNDSGPLHLAAFLGVSTVSFFGPETPLIYGPEGEKHSIFYKNLECSPCIRVKNYKYFACNNNQKCLREIKPDEVMKKIEENLFRKHAGITRDKHEFSHK